jgi:hypothetical protein
MLARSLLALVLLGSATAFAPVTPAALRAAKPAALAGSRSGGLGRVVAPMARAPSLRDSRKPALLNMAVSLPAGTPLKVGIAGEQPFRAAGPQSQACRCRARARAASCTLYVVAARRLTRAGRRCHRRGRKGDRGRA